MFGHDGEKKEYKLSHELESFASGKTRTTSVFSTINLKIPQSDRKPNGSEKRIESRLRICRVKIVNHSELKITFNFNFSCVVSEENEFHFEEAIECVGS